MTVTRAAMLTLVLVIPLTGMACKDKAANAHRPRILKRLIVSPHRL